MNMSNYEKIISENLSKLFSRKSDSEIYIKAFGEECIIRPDGILINGIREISPIGIIISVYSLYADDKELILEPFISLKDMPESRLYHGAFHENVEIPLVSYVQAIYDKRYLLINRMGIKGKEYKFKDTGDFSLVLFPLPKIALRYIFYFEDDEFPASVTCLYSNNASSFLPVDVLADLAEYTSKKIIDIIRSEQYHE